MYTVMVTGGLGSGKSALREELCALGAVSLDLDEVSRRLLETDAAMVADLVAEFGEGILDEDGAVVPGELAKRAFSSPEATQTMNAITFPRILDQVSDYILDVHCAPRHSAKAMVVEVPLLTEVPELAKLADEVVAVTAPSDLRLARVVQRGMDAQDALSRMAVQPTDAQRAAIADTIFDNSGSRADLAAWARSWWEERGF